MGWGQAAASTTAWCLPDLVLVLWGKKSFKLIFFLFVCFKLARGSSKAVTFMGKKALFSSLVRMSSLLK